MTNSIERTDTGVESLRPVRPHRLPDSFPAYFQQSRIFGLVIRGYSAGLCEDRCCALLPEAAEASVQCCRKQEARAQEPAIQDSEYSGPISFNGLAGQRAARRSTLRRAVFQTAECTLHQYLTNIRTERVGTLLRSGHGPAETGHSAGFCNQSHLTNGFRRDIGVTPSDFAVYCRTGGRSVRFQDHAD